MINLQDLSKLEQQSKTLTITDRLPDFLLAPCVLKVTYRVEVKDDFYLMHLWVQGSIDIVCQRCLQAFSHPYDNETFIAVCQSEERAQDLLKHYECIVSPKGQLALEDLIIDELHLYVPKFHPDHQDCDAEIIQILNTEGQT